MEILTQDQMWATEAALRFLVFKVKSRMTVVRLANGELWLHSPTRLDAETRAALAGLGRVTYIVAPNLYHHVFIPDYITAFPDVQVYGVEGLAKKRSDITFSGVLGDEPEAGWSADFDQVIFRGMKHSQEAVFFHRATRTLMVTDLCVWAHPDEIGPFGRVVWGWMGITRQPAMTPMIRMAVKDRAAARDSAERILAWDIERFTTCHGRVLEMDAKRVMTEALSWLFD